MSSYIRAVRRRIAGVGDRGSLSLFFVIVAVALFLIVGLVVDGGGKLNALEHARDVAAEAARSGAEAVQADAAIRGQGAAIDPLQAQQAAQAYLSAAGVQGTVKVISGTQLEVDTTTSYTPVFLSMVGIGPQPEHGHAAVNLQTGG